MRSVVFVVTLLFAAAAAADEVTCGTTLENDRAARELARFVEARPQIRALSSHSTRVVNDFLVVPADGVTAPFDDPADLQGTSFLFTRKSDTAFAVRHEDLVYDAAVGSLFHSFGRGESTKTLELTGFEFPFGTGRHSKLILSRSRGIHFTDRPTLPVHPFTAFEMLTSTEPLISPLFDHVHSPTGQPDIYVKQTASAVTITWRMQTPGAVDYDVQAVLFSNGDVRYSYKKLQRVAWGAVVLTTGNLDAMSRTPLSSKEDPVGDVPEIAGGARGILDVKRVGISRLGTTTMLEVKVELASEIDRAVANGELYSFTIEDSINRFDLYLHPERVIYRVPRVGDLENIGTSIGGATITFFVDEDLLALSSRTPKVWLHTGSNVQADSVQFDLDLGTPARSAETDFSELTVRETSGPFVEGFRVPRVNVVGVWDRLKKDRGYTDDSVDAVFVYTPFLSDLIYQQYGAFALYANPGADGVSAHSSKSQPRTPTLVNMNRLGSFGNFDTQILLHEFGHRWLYYFDILEAGAKRRSLNPLGNHPAQFVHTPAAFNLRTGSDSSVMGGATFTDLKNGTYRSPMPGEWSSSFAWHELYLMGLAKAEEVPGWWYIRDANPALGLEYYPPPNFTVAGSRVEVGIEQVINAMGHRDPSFETSPKNFRVLFVILERPGEPLASEQLDPQYRLRFEDAFSKATGGRGKVRTSAADPVRRRAASK
ncbi:MAG TPA: hypothetical protein VFM36_03515 [Thermoanaerobaculia bacterium]|nr:hypothetical protein [Thermoanaerobaculia bacterium]